MVTRLVITLLMLLPAFSAHAQSDSVSKALSVLEEFHSEAAAQAEGLGHAAGPSFHKGLVESKEKTASEVGSLKWTASPGQKRYDAVYSVLERYMDSGIEAFDGLAASLGNGKGARKAAARLRVVKDALLLELAKSLPYETYEKKKREPVPIIDTSPYEKTPEGEPGGEKGLWYR